MRQTKRAPFTGPWQDLTSKKKKSWLVGPRRKKVVSQEPWIPEGGEAFLSRGGKRLAQSFKASSNLLPLRGERHCGSHSKGGGCTFYHEGELPKGPKPQKKKRPHPQPPRTPQTHPKKPKKKKKKKKKKTQTPFRGRTFPSYKTFFWGGIFSQREDHILVFFLH